MNGKRLKVFHMTGIFVLCFAFSLKSEPRDSTAVPHSFYEMAYGTGMVNNRFTMAGMFVNAGYKNYILTGRFCRSSGEELRGYIFEDAFLLGYRINPARTFSSTFSAGYSDVAFEKGYHTYFDAPADKFKKTSGLSLEAEAEWKIPARNKLSVFSFSAIYYSTFNSVSNLNGFLLAIKFCPERSGKHWYNRNNNKTAL